MMNARNIFAGLRGKLFVFFLSVTFLPLMVISWVSYYTARDALLEQTRDQLVAVRELMKHRLESYFDTIRKQSITMSENKMVIDAMLEFTEAFYSIDAPSLPGRYLRSLRAYYAGEYLPRLNVNLDRPVELDQYWPTEDLPLYLQYFYISNNPYDVGQKDKLARVEDGTSYSDIHEAYHPIFKNYLNQFGYYDIFLVDNQGHIVYSVFKEVDFATNLLTGPYRHTNFAKAFRVANEASEPGFVRLLDYEPYDPSYHAPASFIASPIFVGDKKIGVLVFQMPISRINSILTNNQDWRGVGLGETGEVYIVGADHKMRSDSRFLAEATDEHIRQQGTTILLKEIQSQSTEAALQGRRGVEVFPDDRRKWVLSAYAPLAIKDMNWVLLAEVDMSEAMVPVEELGQYMLHLTSLVSILVIVIGIFIAMNLSRPFVEMSEIAERVADGDLSVDVPFASRRDEIGTFGQLFQGILASFRQQADTAEQLSKGDASVVVTPQSDRDVLGHALARIAVALRRQDNDVA